MKDIPDFQGHNAAEAAAGPRLQANTKNSIVSWENFFVWHTHASSIFNGPCLSCLSRYMFWSANGRMLNKALLL